MTYVIFISIVHTNITPDLIKFAIIFFKFPSVKSVIANNLKNKAYILCRYFSTRDSIYSEFDDDNNYTDPCVWKLSRN